MGLLKKADMLATHKYYELSLFSKFDWIMILHLW